MTTQIDSYTMAVQLERFEEPLAIFSSDGLGEFRWPIEKLPPDVKPGDSLSLKISTGKIEEEEKYGRMRRLLEELIN